MPDEINRDRRRFLGAATASIAAFELGLFSAADAQPNTNTLAGAHLSKSGTPFTPAVNGAGNTTASADGELVSLAGATAWLNSEPLSSAGLQGKVVLVHFWTYTCINWLRTLPYVRAWSEKYRDKGLVVIGVHSPEFLFEKNIENVRRATRDLRVNYPVAVDSNHAIWRGFNNNYWPALYLLDARGRNQYHQFGEGEYERSEKMIQKLLTEAGAVGVGAQLVDIKGTGAEAPADLANLRSQESYLGFERAQDFASKGGAVTNQRHQYALPAKLQLNEWALLGEWTMQSDLIRLNKAGGRIAYRFHARDVHIVMGPSKRGTTARFRVLIDGQPPGAAHGGDVDEQGVGTLAEQRMYQLIRQQDRIIDRRFEIEFLDAGADAFVFTFG